jgi:hypothetical protein
MVVLELPVVATEIRFFDASVATACEAVNPDNCKLVPIAAPISGVTSVGETDNTTEPVPAIPGVINNVVLDAD